MDLELVLRRAVELGASDIHLKVERPPIVRRDGNLGELEGYCAGAVASALELLRSVANSVNHCVGRFTSWLTVGIARLSEHTTQRARQGPPPQGLPRRLEACPAPS